MTESIKSALRSKTIRFSIALAVFGVIETNVGFFQHYMTSQAFGGFSMVIAMIVAVLRVLTTVPLSEK